MHHVGTPRAFQLAMERGAKLRGCRYPTWLAFCWCPALFLVASLLGCGVVGTGTQPPPNITVMVTPLSASVLLGEPQTFIAVVANGTDTAVTWSVDGVPGGNAAFGTINASGIYTAPANLPTPDAVTVTAASLQNPAKSSTAQVTIASDITVSVSPQAVSVELGAVRPFTANLNSAGNPNPSVTWNLSGSGCAGAACGTVNSSGTYTAPQILPQPPMVTLIVISVADSSRISTATIDVTSSFSLAVAGLSSVNAGSATTYAATLLPAANSNPSLAISWSATGTGCTGTACGAITASGVYTAPMISPSPASVQIVATPLADPAKAAAFSVTVLPIITVSITPSSASVPLGTAQTFQAMVTGALDSTVTWDVNGVVGGNATVGKILNSQTSPDSTTYTAPQIVPARGSLTVHARSNSDPSFSGSAAVTLLSAISVNLAPANAALAVNERQTFTVLVNSGPNQNVAWLVNGIAGGNSASGLICVTASNPCQPVSASNGGSVDYIAPAGLPSPNPVTIAAVSQVDSNKSASASVTILPHVVVGVVPGSALLAGTEQLRFSASVTGTVNSLVIWQITGRACANPEACGSIDSSGLYTAPAALPSPNLIDIVAVSSEDITQSGTATLSITSGPAIFSLAPTSAYAGTAGGFTLLLTGNNFAPAIPGPGSTVLVSGTARTTSCASVTQCITSLNAPDLQSAGNLSVQLQNPDGTLSNTQTFVVLAQGSGMGTIPLTPSAPISTGNDIVVVELSTNGGSGASGNISLNVAAVGRLHHGHRILYSGGKPSRHPAARLGKWIRRSVRLFRERTVFLVHICCQRTGNAGHHRHQSRAAVPGTTAPDSAGSRNGCPRPANLFIVNPEGDKAAGTGSIEVR